MDIFSQEGSMLLEEEIDDDYEPTEEGSFSIYNNKF